MRRSAAQRHRLNRVMNFAQNHIAEALNLDVLADVACFSKYHFTRAFGAYAQETPLHHLWRIRLERAARMLVFVRDRAITDVALECGFSCSQTFSRSFRQRFNTSPRAFQAANQWSYAGFPNDERRNTVIEPPADLTPDTGGVHAPVRVEARPEYRVAYLRHIGPYGNPNGGIAETYRALRNWAHAHGLRDHASDYIGLCPDHAAITPATHCRYDACIVVPDTIGEDEVVSIQTIPGGTYAVMHVKPDGPRLHAKWEWLTSDWLPGSDIVCDPILRYEFYPPTDGNAGRPETGVDLCLRVQEAKAG